MRVGGAEADAEVRLGVLGGHAHQAGDPNPEERAGAAERDRGGHTDDIAHADGGGERSRKRLEVGDITAVLVGAVAAAIDKRMSQRAAQHAELEATEAVGQPQPGEEKERHEDEGSPYHCADGVEDALYIFHVR